MLTTDATDAPNEDEEDEESWDEHYQTERLIFDRSEARYINGKM